MNMAMFSEEVSVGQLFCPSVDACGQQPYLLGNRVPEIIPNAAGRKEGRVTGKSLSTFIQLTLRSGIYMQQLPHSMPKKHNARNIRICNW
jgi:hypothetical protein